MESLRTLTQLKTWCASLKKRLAPFNEVYGVHGQDYGNCEFKCHFLESRVRSSATVSHFYRALAPHSGTFSA